MLAPMHEPIAVDPRLEPLLEPLRDFLSDRWWMLEAAEGILRHMEDARHRMAKVDAELKSLLEAFEKGSQPEKLGKEKRPQRKRGRRRRSEGRDLQIAIAISMVVGGGFSPTRSHTKRRLSTPSACSTVQTALAQLGEHMSERTIEDIWHRHKEKLAPSLRP
jgi:hypothetical protein